MPDAQLFSTSKSIARPDLASQKVSRNICGVSALCAFVGQSCRKNGALEVLVTQTTIFAVALTRPLDVSVVTDKHITAKTSRSAHRPSETSAPFRQGITVLGEILRAGALTEVFDEGGEQSTLPTWTMYRRRNSLSLWTELLQLAPESATSCAAGSYLFHEGDLGSHILLLKNGLIKLTCTLPDGAEAIVALVATGQFIDYAFTDHQRRRFASATAVVKSDVYYIDARRLEKLLATDGRVAQLVVRGIESDLAEALRVILEMKTLTTQQRFGRFLHWLAEVQNVGPIQLPLNVPVPLKDREIAQVLGISKENFSRLLHKMTSAGQIRRWARRT